MAGISIDVAADTRDFVKAVGGDMPKALDKVSDALDDVAKDGDKAGDKLEDSLKDAQRQTDKTQKAFKELAQAEEKAGRDGADGYARETRRGAKEASGSIKEIRGEALQNASETFSSYQGDAQGLLDGIQGTFGGIVSSLGPLGAAAGAAGAIGIGLISAAFQTAGDNDEALKQKVSDLADEFITTGRIGQTSLDFLIDKLKTAATVTDGSSKSLKDLNDIAKRSGSSFKDLAQAYAGNANGLKDLWRASQDRIDSLKDQRDAVLSSQDADKSAAVTLNNKLKAEQEYQAYLGQALGTEKQAAEQTRLYNKAGGERLALLSKINEAYDDAASSVDDYVDSETGVFNVDAYITAMQSKTDALKAYQENLKSLGGELGPSATSYLESLGTEQAAVLLQGYKDASPGQRQALDAIWAEAGKSNSGQYNSSLQAGIPKTLKGPTITVDADTSLYDSAVRRINGQVFRAYVDFAPRNGSRVF